MHSGPSICTQLSLFLLSGPPSFLLQLPEDRPLYMLSATGLLVAFGLGKDWGFPGPTRRERPRTVTPWAQSQCPQRASPVLPFLKWGRAGDREEARPRQDLRHCLPLALGPTCAHRAHILQRPSVSWAVWAAPPFLPEGLEGRMGGCSPQDPKGPKKAHLEGRANHV